MFLVSQQEYGKLPPIDYASLGTDPSSIQVAEKRWWRTLVYNVFDCKEDSEVQAKKCMYACMYVCVCVQVAENRRWRTLVYNVFERNADTEVQAKKCIYVCMYVCMYVVQCV